MKERQRWFLPLGRTFRYAPLMQGTSMKIVAQVSAGTLISANSREEIKTAVDVFIEEAAGEHV